VIPVATNFPHESASGNAEIARRRLWLRIGAVLLLLAVTSLSTFAKNSLYSPHTTEVKFVNIASKMKTAKTPAVFERVDFPLARRLDSPLAAYREPVRIESTAPAIQPIGRVVSPQRRPPPEILA
jgi:hypothetical protein